MPKAKADTVKASELLTLLEEQGYCCAYSGRPLTPEVATVDHRQPLSRGGTNEISNLAIVHHQVNVSKSSMTVEEFIAVCREVVDWFDRKQQDNNCQITIGGSSSSL